MACSQDEAELWTTVVIQKGPKVAKVETQVASEVSVASTDVVLVEEYDAVLGLLLDHCWNRWNEEEKALEALEALEDLRNWIKVRTVSHLETGPTRETCRAAWMTRFIFWTQKMFQIYSSICIMLATTSRLLPSVL